MTSGERSAGKEELPAVRAPRVWSRPFASLAQKLGAWSALGVVAATIMTLCTNVLAVRFYQRWDVTSGGFYTLSAPSLETLRSLSETIDVLVFLSQSDPELGGVQRLIGQYQAESKLINVRYVDPDRDPAEFVALRNRYRLSEGRAEQGHLVSDAALVVARGDARWVIGPEDIVAYDEEQGTATPELERALTEGLRQVQNPKPTEVCFSRGHEEPSLDDGGPTGLGALQHVLQKNNYGTREVDLGASGGELALASCDLVIVAAPAEPFAGPAVSRLVGAVRRGKSVLVSVGPSLDEDNRTTQSGLEPLLLVFGVRPKGQLIFERDPDAVLPVGIGGEVFLAAPKPHAITEGLVLAGEARYRVLLQLSQALESEGKVAPLLGTSERAFSVANAALLANAGVDIDDIQHDGDGPFLVAMAAELEAPASSDKRGARLVVIGSASPLLGNTWQDPTLAGTRRFVESALSWLVSRPNLVNVPAKPGRQVELRFTEESLSQVVRYVLLYMPGTALALGLLILYRRRFVRAARGAPDGGAK